MARAAVKRRPQNVAKARRKNGRVLQLSPLGAHSELPRRWRLILNFRVLFMDVARFWIYVLLGSIFVVQDSKPLRLSRLSMKTPGADWRPGVLFPMHLADMGRSVLRRTMMRGQVEADIVLLPVEGRVGLDNDDVCGWFASSSSDQHGFARF